MKYAFIKSVRAQFSVFHLCRILRVSRSGYYDWLGRPESRTRRRHRDLARIVPKGSDSIEVENSLLDQNSGDQGCENEKRDRPRLICAR